MVTMVFEKYPFTHYAHPFPSQPMFKELYNCVGCGTCTAFLCSDWLQQFNSVLFYIQFHHMGNGRLRSRCKGELCLLHIMELGSMPCLLVQGVETWCNGGRLGTGQCGTMIV